MIISNNKKVRKFYPQRAEWQQVTHTSNRENKVGLATQLSINNMLSSFKIYRNNIDGNVTDSSLAIFGYMGTV